MINGLMHGSCERVKNLITYIVGCLQCKWEMNYLNFDYCDFLVIMMSIVYVRVIINAAQVFRITQKLAYKTWRGNRNIYQENETVYQMFVSKSWDWEYQVLLKTFNFLFSLSHFKWTWQFSNWPCSESLA